MATLFFNSKHGHAGGTVLSNVYLTNINGAVVLEICDKCNELVSVTCECKNNTWIDKDGNKVLDPLGKDIEAAKGILLKCNLCGGDGT